MRQPLQRLVFDPQQPEVLGSFDLDELFNLSDSNRSRYELEVRVIIFKITRGRHFEPIKLPSAKLTVHLPK